MNPELNRSKSFQAFDQGLLDINSQQVRSTLLMIFNFVIAELQIRSII